MDAVETNSAELKQAMRAYGEKERSTGNKDRNFQQILLSGHCRPGRRPYYKPHWNAVIARSGSFGLCYLAYCEMFFHRPTVRVVRK